MTEYRSEYRDPVTNEWVPDAGGSLLYAIRNADEVALECGYMCRVVSTLTGDVVYRCGFIRNDRG